MSAQKPLLVVPTGHSGGVRSFMPSADGKYFLTLGGDNLIKLWNEEGKEIKTIRSVEQRYGSVKLSPNNEFILATSPYANADAWVLKVATGEPAFTLHGHTGYIQCENYSPDGRWIATGAQDSTAILWNADDGSLIRRFAGHRGLIGSISFSPDGKLLATLSEDKTAKIWETASGKLIKTLKVCQAIPDIIQFSPDGKLISVTCWGENLGKNLVSLWSTATWERVKEIEGYSICFSPDGQWTCVFNQVTAYVYASDKLDGTPLRTLQATLPSMDGPMVPDILYGAFLSDSKRMLLNASNVPEVYEMETGRLQFALDGYSIPMDCASFSPDSRHCMVGSGAKLLELDMQEGRLAKCIEGNDIMTNARYAPDGRKIVSITQNCTGSIWDADNGKELLQLEPTICFFPIPYHARILEISPDSQYFVRGYGMGNKNGPPMLGIGQFSSATKVDSLLYPFEESGEPEQVAISQEGKKIAVLAQAKLLVWDLNTRQWDSIFNENQFGLGPMTFYGKNLIAIGVGDELDFWDIQQKKQVGKTWMRKFHMEKEDTLGLDLLGSPLLEAGFGDVECSPNGKWLAAAFGKRIYLWGCTAGNLPEPVHFFEGHDNAVKQIGFSPDSRWLISCSYDNTVRIWDLEKKTEVARIVFLKNADWAVTTPSGLFDATPGAMELMYFISGDEVIELEQLKVRYYEPGLLSKLLGLASGELRDVKQFKDLSLYPKIEAEIVQNQLNIQLVERNGGIGKLSLFINGQERGSEDINPMRKTSLSIDLKPYATFFLKDTVNTIALRAYNAEGWLKSQAYKLPYAYSGAKGGGQAGDAPTLGDAKPRLFAIIVGTADYSGDKLDLKYADQDAASIASAIASAGRELFENDVHIKLLNTGSNVTADVASGLASEISSKANIKAAFEAFAKPGELKLSDVLVLYFSGHGITYGEAEKAQFYYLTKDIASEDLSDPEVRGKFTISSDELTEWIKNIPAQKQVLILDACNSGKIVETLASIGQKDLNPSQVRAFDRMKDRTGVFILTGSAANKVSYEASQYGQGLLTYSLLEGMSGVALAAENKVDVMKLFQHARDKVPELAKSINGIQTPILAFPLGGGSFDIGMVNKNVKIPLAQVKPVFIRNYFQDEDAFEDVLGLTDALEQYFRQQTAKGAQSKLLYWDVKEFENAYSMKGRYKVTGEDVSVRVRLYKGKTQLGEEFNVNGKKEDVPGLVKEILRVVMPKAK